MGRHLSALVCLSLFGASLTSAAVIEDWSSGTDANWTRIDFLSSPPGPVDLGGTSFGVAGGRYSLTSNASLPALPIQAGAASVFTGSLADPTLFADGVVQTTVRFGNDSTDAFLLLRGDLGAGTYYNLAFGAGLPGTGMQINRFEGFTTAIPLVVTSIPALQPNVDYNVQFSAIGTTLSGKIWAVGDAEPALPQVSVVDATHAQGALGLGYANGINLAGPLAASFGAVSFVPEPPSALLLVLAAAMLRRR